MLAVAPAEAGQDRELLLELRLTDERAPSPTPVEVPLRCELDEGLPDGGEADTPPLRQLLFRREPRTGKEAVGDDLLADEVVDLAVQRHERASM